ncbi:MAG: methyltransferase domain-containing protein [Maricaulaceae bacterium]
MKRETTNVIRTVIEDWIPPVLRDSPVFAWLAARVWGRHIHDLAAFRQKAAQLTEAEYEALYRAHPRVHEQTDNSKACIDRIIADIAGESVCDVGCGTGYLLTRIQKGRPELKRLVGVDFVIDETQAPDGISLQAAKIEALPFEDNAFDTVVCTHVIEHILDYCRAIAELRRIARKRLIIVVPREREFIYTFNPHFNFFPYTHAFLRAMAPLPTEYSCDDIQRDIYYRETCETPEVAAE